MKNIRNLVAVRCRGLQAVRHLKSLGKKFPFRFKSGLRHHFFKSMQNPPIPPLMENSFKLANSSAIKKKGTKWIVVRHNSAYSFSPFFPGGDSRMIERKISVRLSVICQGCPRAFNKNGASLEQGNRLDLVV